MRRDELKYKRDHISKRAAVHFIAKVAELYEDAGYYDPVWISSYNRGAEDALDGGVYSLLADIRLLLKEREQLRAWKKVLKEVVES